jgi:hypothetical protein
MISIMTISGASTIGAPSGRKYEKKCSPCVRMATAVARQMTKMASAPVTAMWLV